MAQFDDLVQEEVDVLVLCSRIGQHTAEEVDFGSQRLIANHDGAFLHHPGFDLRSHLHTHSAQETHSLSGWSQ